MKLGVVGATGRMGQSLIKLILGSTTLQLLGVTDRHASDAVGQDVGEIIGGRATGVLVQSDPYLAFRDVDAILDFSNPKVTLENAEFAAQARIVHVIGTTGLSDENIKALEFAAQHAVIIRSGNMSLGVNLLTVLAEQVARVLSEDFDVEITEAHHRHKIDAPSGTALMLGHAVAQGRGVALDAVSDRGRDGITGARTPGHIGFHAIRGGQVIGAHDVMFIGMDEQIVLSHTATDRTLFARGALHAAKWGVGQPPGAYSMRDVLGL